MDAPVHEGQDRIAPTGDRPVEPHISMEQALSANDERIVSANPSLDAAFVVPSREVIQRLETSNTGGDFFSSRPQNAYASHEQMRFYGGYGNSTGTWDGYSQYVNTDGLQISPVVYNDNPSLMFHSGYGFNPEMAYGQYSPVGAPLTPILIDGQLFSPQQVPFSPSYYPQHATLNVPSSVPVSPSELISSESSGENLLFGPGSSYLVQFGSFGGGNVPGNVSCHLNSPAPYPQPMGILGSYEHHIGQLSQQQRPLHGFGVASPIGRHSHSGSYQSSTFDSASISYTGSNDRTRLILDKGRRRERDQDSIYISNDLSGLDRNRGPRASKFKAKSSIDQSSSSGNGRNDSSSKNHSDIYNRQDFPTEYEIARFFIIKSFSEDNVHRSIKYNVWASTPHGNKKLDSAYHEAKGMEGNCPVFLMFSVNASGQFCGVAAMVGPVDFEKDVNYWQQDRWSGQFPVQWHIVKDVPNSRFRHILLENNENKPVTHSRDSQEVKLEQGIEMLKIFKDYDSRTSILDDFDFYDDRERGLKERKSRQQALSIGDAPNFVGEESINQVADSLALQLHLDEEGNKVILSNETGGSSVAATDGSDSVSETTGGSNQN
ncbi:hypothetical protein HS088_TW04G00590 [Tripterygium wilfordii]|uniref:YTH domain-containing family protein n=1 Tax=Tripterygium wilfordii TaxID=458696 RepID=A0A7J7DQF3_TRIWF|nr:YTH domain-containing protein ECT4-like [Tripterygium wilfordii]KAF5748632.1 hypothetical protein HS088_TW04G00590 [Tripterygium wilfordii]